ncbi:MAG: SRPBCC family protein [Deltaproteobacteria bacterium]|nr:SRPBCC family protein [Deltaproteobacteria bacterium]
MDDRGRIGVDADMRALVVEVTGSIAAELETVFDVLARIDLRTIMQGYGPLPAVEGVEDQTGNWDSIGESRIIRLADGSGMLETLTAVDRPRHFAYTISEPTNALRFLIATVRGAWTFEQAGAADSSPIVKAIWRNELRPRSILTWPLTWLIVKRFWQPYMAAALARASLQVVEACDRSAG